MPFCFFNVKEGRGDNRFLCLEDLYSISRTSSPRTPERREKKESGVKKTFRHLSLSFSARKHYVNIIGGVFLGILCVN